MVVLVIVTASSNRVILNTAHVLMVDVNVGMRALPVVQVCNSILGLNVRLEL
jgi:hypothetical protein